MAPARRLAILVALAVCPCLAGEPAAEPRVKLAGSRLLVDGAPFFFFGPSAHATALTGDLLNSYRYNSFFAHDGAMLNRVTADNTGGLWLIPFFSANRWGLSRMQRNFRQLAEHPQILVWNMGDDLLADDADRVRQFCEWAAAHDALQRPMMLDYVIGSPEHHDAYRWLSGMASVYDYPLLQRPLAEYQQQLRQGLELAGAERAFWTWVQVHTQDWYNHMFFSCNSLPTYARHRLFMYPDPEHVRLLSYNAMAAGAKGILQYRGDFLVPEFGGGARIAESGIVASELEVIGPWLVDGKYRGKLTCTPEADATCFEFSRGMLIVLVRQGEHYEYHADAAFSERTAVHLRRQLRPGEHAVRVDFPALKRLDTDEDGTIEIGAWELTSAVLVTSVPELVEEVGNKLAERLPDAARFGIEVAETKYGHVQQTVAELRKWETDPLRLPDDEQLSLSAAEIADAKSHAANGRHAQAFAAARRAQRRLRAQVFRSWNAMWDDPAIAFARHERPLSGLDDPGEFTRRRYGLQDFFIMPLFYKLVYAERHGDRPVSRVANASFEDVDGERFAGWTAHFTRTHQTQGKPVPADAARTGQRALSLTTANPAWYAKEKRAVDWVTQEAVSGFVPVRYDDVVEMSVWVKIAEDFQKTQRGVVLHMLPATANGGRLSKWNQVLVQSCRKQKTDGWEKLTLRRLMTDPDIGQVAVRLGVCGVGTALFDDASVTVCRLPGAETPQAAEPSDSANVVRNPGFETKGAIAPWQWTIAGGADATGELDATLSHSGAQSFRITNASPRKPHVCAYVHLPVGLNAAAKYRISAWLKGKGVRGGYIGSAGGVPQRGWKLRQSLPTGDFDWREVTFEFTTYANEESMTLAIVVGAPAGGLWIDDVSLTEIE